MVKQLDDTAPPLIEHIGWLLWRISGQWSNRFREGMVAAGWPLFAEARANVIPHLSRQGTRQSELSERMQISKQAVQQFVNALVKDGLIEQIVDPNDSRGRILVFTKKGFAALAAANRVKRRIEEEYRSKLGEKRFGQLCEALKVLDE